MERSLEEQAYKAPAQQFNPVYRQNPPGNGFYPQFNYFEPFNPYPTSGFNPPRYFYRENFGKIPEHQPNVPLHFSKSQYDNLKKTGVNFNKPDDTGDNNENSGYTLPSLHSKPKTNGNQNRRAVPPPSLRILHHLMQVRHIINN